MYQDLLNMQPQYTPKQLLEDPLVDKGDGLQALATRHARLYLHVNIWHRPPEWVRFLEDMALRQRYAFALYCRLVQRYGVTSPLPADGQVIDPMWWETSPITSTHLQETESQALARILYIVAFSQELRRYTWKYIGIQSGKWNNRIHELAQASPEAYVVTCENKWTHLGNHPLCIGNQAHRLTEGNSLGTDAAWREDPECGE